VAPYTKLGDSLFSASDVSARVTKCGLRRERLPLLRGKAAVWQLRYVNLALSFQGFADSALRHAQGCGGSDLADLRHKLGQGDALHAVISCLVHAESITCGLYQVNIGGLRMKLPPVIQLANE
jgi:hypothetical protein